MKRSWAASAGALFVIALIVSIALRGDPLEYSATSYGALPEGYGALHDLLLELDVPVARSFASPRRLAPGATVWWIEPNNVCALLGAEELAAWIRAGGAAVIFSAAVSGCDAESGIADLDLPGVRLPPEDARGERGERVERAADALPDDAPARLVTGPLVPTSRRLLLPEVATFTTVPEGFTVIASADGTPFALEARIGSGQLVLAADSQFLRNRWLDRGDAAPFTFDWVRAYGVPALDEWEHGLSETPSTVTYLASSPALPVFAGLAASGVLFGFAGASLPRRRIGDERLGPPALDAYIDSLARLYARAGDHADVFERYRAFGRAELRRALSLAHDAPADRIRRALRGRSNVSESDLAAMDGPVAVRGRGDLDAACAAIDRLIAVVR